MSNIFEADDLKTAESMIEKTIARLTAEVGELNGEIQLAAEHALQDWLLVEACKDYDTIELDEALTGKARRKQFKALREKKRNLEKMIVALQDLQQLVQAPEGEKLHKKFEAERAKYEN
jgi:hypothetical protein